MATYNFYASYLVNVVVEAANEQTAETIAILKVLGSDETPPTVTVTKEDCYAIGLDDGKGGRDIWVKHPLGE
jgi:hypothetical protein